MINEWVNVTLKSLTLKIGSGSTPRGGANVYTLVGSGFIRSQNIYDGKFEFNGLARLSKEAAHELRNVAVIKDDVLINITGDSVTRTCIVPLEALPAYVSQHVAIIRPDSNLIDPRFLSYLLLSPEVKQKLDQFSQAGATRKALTKAHLENLVVCIPKIQTQQRIAKTLGSIDDLIQLNISLADSLKAMVEARFQAILSTPSTRQKLGTVIDLKYGKALPARERREGTVAVVSSAGIIDVHDEMLVNGPGIVVGRKGTVGSITWVDSDFFPIDTAFYVESNMPLLFVYFSLKQLDLDRMNTDSAVPGLNRNNALSQAITVPSSSEVGNFSEFATPLWTTASQLDSENVQLARIRNELLPLLLTGAIKVKEVAA